MRQQPNLVGSVHHVSFRVDDLDAALDFYVGALGCEKMYRPDIDVPGAWLMAGTTQVHLIQTPICDATGTPPSQINPVASHVAFHTEDLDAAEAALQAGGFTTSRGPSPLIAQLFVRDPSGNMVELIPG